MAINAVMPTRRELQDIAKSRLKEVKVLYRNRMYDGAKYLSGYIVETALKARICKILDSDYPAGEMSKLYFTHKFDLLVKLAGLQKLLDRDLNADVDFKTNWSLVTQDWTEEFRYRPIGTSSQRDIEDILNALEDRDHGVLTWIKKRW